MIHVLGSGISSFITGFCSYSADRLSLLTGGRLIGMSTVKVVPFPFMLSTAMSPLCKATKCLTKAKPIPLPPLSERVV